LNCFIILDSKDRNRFVILMALADMCTVPLCGCGFYTWCWSSFVHSVFR